jgi:UDP-N-acetylmuramoyl-tripeptide--D-alanyl-D-alanine ligase
MISPTLGWLARILDVDLYLLDPDLVLGPISIDTRTLQQGDTFWALSATRNGHEFVHEAIAAGAKIAVVNAEWSKSPQAAPFKNKLIAVSDTRQALIEAGKSWRTLFPFPVIGITGSNGKTSTKDLVLRLLSLKYPTAGTKGNLNNELGVPLTLLDIPLGTQIAVVEMGASNVNEIGMLCEICKPTHGLVTSIGKAHLEGFGSLSALAETKGELYDFVSESGTAFVPTDDRYCVSESSDCRSKIGFGFKDNPADWKGVYHHGENLRFDNLGMGHFLLQGIEINLGIAGRPPAISALAALAVAQEFGLSVVECRDAIREWHGVKGRTEILHLGGITVINDSYNSNPVSVRAALELLTMLPATRRIAMLGDMNELGDVAVSEHEQLGFDLADYAISKAILVGSLSQASFKAALSRGIDAVHYSSYEELEPHLTNLYQEGDVVLIKASRTMKLERVVQYFQQALV